MTNYEEFLNQVQSIENSVEAFEKEREKELASLEEKNKMSDLRTQLYEKYHHKYGMINKAEKRHYSKEELDAIRAELANTNIWTLIKRFFGFGKKNDELYGDLMGKIDGALACIKEELEEQRENKRRALEIFEECAVAYENNYCTVLSVSGCSADTDWGFYQEVEELQGNLYLCDIDIELDVENISNDSDMQLRELMPHSYSNKLVRVPYTIPLSNTVHILYEYRRNNTVQASQSMRSMIYQILRMTPAYYVQFHFMDAKNMGRDSADLIDLQRIKKTDVNQLNYRITGGRYQMAKLYLNEKEINNGLRQLEEHMNKVTIEMGARASLDIYNQELGEKMGIIPYQVLVIENFPYGFSDDEIHLIDTLIRNGENCGISVIILEDLDKWEQVQKVSYSNQQKQFFQDCLSMESKRNLNRIQMDGLNNTCISPQCSDTCKLQMLLEGKPNYIQQIINTKMAVIKVDNYFPHVINTKREFGQMSSEDGLYIPFAIDEKGRIIEYSLGKAMNAHGLICGGTGSGKSTLLHMLISSIVMNYRPDDVELWLVDYKITEFYSYKTNTPPHIGFLGLSKTPDFSYAFIDKIINEMRRRQDIIAEADFNFKMQGGKGSITNFDEYRKKFGIASMRRLIVIIDEFHVMAQYAQQETAYKEKLENILAEARAFGIILLFSDQAIVDGLRGLSEKGKKQIKARIAMSNFPDELKATLNENDMEKLKSFLQMQQGEVVIQTMREDKENPNNEIPCLERAKTIYIDGEWRYKINARARKVYNAEDYQPDIFDDREIEPIHLKQIEEWEKTSLRRHRDGSKDLQMYLGRPVNLQFSMNFPMLRRKGNNIMSIAGTEEQQMQIFRAVTTCFMREKDVEILVMTDLFASLYREYGEDISRIALQNSQMKVYEELEDICYQVNRLLGIMSDRGNEKKILVIWLGLDVIADLLNEERAQKPVELLRIAQGQNGQKDTLEKVWLKKEAVKESSEQNNFEDMFNSLFGDDNEDEEIEEEEDVSLEENYLYNACEDIVKIVHLGPTRNIYNMVIYDSAAALRDFRAIKTADFNHKIAFSMSENEASDFLDRSSLIRGLPEYMAYYYDGRMGRKFIPYK